MGGYVGILFPPTQGVTLFTDGQHVPSIYVAAKPGVSEKTLTARIAAVLPADLKAETGDQVRQDQKNTLQSILSFINYFLLAFGLIALLVGTFIIYNTFSMIVAQRLRELALAAGDRRQPAPGEPVGAVRGRRSSACSVACSVWPAGIGLAYGLAALLKAVGSGLPGGGLVLSARTVIISLVVGIGVTVISAYAPARRAAKIPPVAAMRAEFASTGSSLRIRTIIGAVVFGVGVLAAIGGACRRAPAPARPSSGWACCSPAPAR